MADVDRRRARPGLGQGATTPGVPSSPQHSRDERMAGVRVLQRVKPEKARAQFCLPAHPYHPYAALVWCIELLVCATANHVNLYCPCEIPVQNEAAMPFLEAG